MPNAKVKELQSGIHLPDDAWKKMLNRHLVATGWSSQQLLQRGAAGEWELGSGIWGLQVTKGQSAKHSWTCGWLLEEC